EAVFSYLPLHYQSFKLPLEVVVIIALTILNIRGLKESVRSLLPFFLVFVATHLILIVGGILSHSYRIPEVVSEVHSGLASGLSVLGTWGLLVLFMRA